MDIKKYLTIRDYLWEEMKRLETERKEMDNKVVKLKQCISDKYAQEDELSTMLYKLELEFQGITYVPPKGIEERF